MKINHYNQHSWAYTQIIPFICVSIATKERGIYVSFGWLRWCCVVGIVRGMKPAAELEKEKEDEPKLSGTAKNQPEADLEAEFERFLNDVEGAPRMYHSDEQIEWGKDIARHFAEWGRTQKPSPQPKGNTDEFDDYNPALLG